MRNVRAMKDVDMDDEPIICESFSILDREPMSESWLKNLMEQAKECEEIRDGRWKVMGKWACYYLRFVDGVFKIDIVSYGMRTVARIEGCQGRGEMFLNLLEIPSNYPEIPDSCCSL